MKLFQLLVALLATHAIHAAPANAASPDAIQAVLFSDALKEASGGRADITNISEHAVFRCPGCFTFEVSLGRGTEARKIMFSTSAKIVNGAWAYNVKQNEVQKPTGSCIAVGRVGGEDVACAKHNDRNSCESRTDWEWCSWQSR